MKVEGFAAKHIMAHEAVVAYYDRIALGLPFVSQRERHMSTSVSR